MRKKKVVKIKRRKMENSAMLIMIVVLFCLYCGLMIFQRSSINALDTQLRELENKYEVAVKVNDDLQARILKSNNLNEIESYAVNILGMIKPQNSYISYVSYSSPEDEIMYSANSKSEIIDWISNLFE